MDKKDQKNAPADPVPTDTEIEAAAARLSRNWGQPTAPSHAAGSNQILQSLTRGRSHLVTVEIKRGSRRRDGSR